MTLSDQNISILNENICRNNDNLDEINFHSNRIIEINDNVFKSCGQMRSLIITNNRLSNLKNQLFEDMNNLINLDLTVTIVLHPVVYES